MRGVTAEIVSVALHLKWLTTKPKWIEQWPLTREKSQAPEQLVLEQLKARQKTTSLWNSHGNLSEKKKLGEWTILTNLKVVN